jgi:cupin 2 domain-containing protein
MNNLFADLPSSLVEELVTVIAANRHVRIERIVSTGHRSAENFWYQQQEHEWVVVLQGEARLLFEGDDAPVPLVPGDHVLIPARTRHRVEWSTADEPTVWLAVFYADS